MPLTVDRTTLDSGIIVLSPNGAMTLGPQLYAFEDTVKQLAKEGHKRIIIDMSQVTYVDSSAIGALVGCHTLIHDAGGHFRFAALVDRVQKIFRMAAVEGVLAIDKTREESIANFPPAA